MRRMQLLTGLFWGLMLWCITGCTNYPLDQAQVSPDTLAGMPDHRLCQAYTWNRALNLEAELRRRGTFTELEWQAIKGRKVVMGMSEIALMVALPGVSRTRTHRSNGVVASEWYFARLTDLRIRTENGKVVWFE
jgi:hypothetical protein